MYTLLVVAVVLLYYVGLGLSFGFFKAATHFERPKLSLIGAIVWPLGWLVYGAFVLFVLVSSYGVDVGQVVSDRLDTLGG